MGNVAYIKEWRDRVSSNLSVPERSKSGGGDGGDNDMLEKRVGKIESDLTDIKVELAKISAKLDSKVDYKWLTIYVLGIVAVIMRSEIAAFFAGS